MSRFVRQSKFRHIFGKTARPDDQYAQIKVTRSAWDTNKLAASTKYWACIWEAGGGGAFVVSTYEDTGKRTPNPPLVAGHKGAVLDIQFHPFNYGIIGSTSEDCSVKIWQIPEGGLTETMTEPVQQLMGHRRKVGTIDFHPTANNLVVTSATDYTVKVWDIEKGECALDVGGHSNTIQSTAWNYDGSLLATASKDKTLRIIDPRANEVVASKEKAHQGVKGFRAVWLGNTGKLASVGFSRTSDRQYALWDHAANGLDKAEATANIDTASGQLMPFFDEDTSVLYLAGKGDGNIRYYEVVPEDDKRIHFLSEFKSSTPQKGMCMVPKRILDVPKCEVVRMLKVTPKNVVEPVSFTVPRKSELFQEDIYPDTYAGVAALDADQWLAGENKDPVLQSMEPDSMPKEEDKAVEVTFDKKEEVVLDERQLREAHDKHTKRIAFLEAEMKKKDARIAELEAQLEG